MSLPAWSGDEAVLRFQPDVQAAGIARDFVARHGSALASEVLADAQLLVSEIVTNAVRHGRGDLVLRVRAFPPGVGVAVTDDGVGNPVVRSPTAEATSGRGMLIVAALAHAWGVSEKTPGPGKTVWFDLFPS